MLSLNTRYTILFVLLWGSAAIFSRVALDHADAFTVLVCRFALAIAVLLLIQLVRRQPLWPRVDWPHTLGAGLLLVAGYCSFYFLALTLALTPGVLATILGVQPILTLLILERSVRPLRALGLTCAFAGLVLMVSQGFMYAQITVVGLLCAFAALLCLTFGAIVQKRQQQDLVATLLAQYGVSLLVFVGLMLLKGEAFTWTPAFFLTVGWLGVVVSVLAQMLFYYLVRAQNLVNTTSLFYLVPCVTVAMDYVFLGNAFSSPSLVGMFMVFMGIFMVFYRVKQP